MKREILFKAKRVDGGGWIESMTISTGLIKRKADWVFMELQPDVWKQIVPYTVCQFTGLLDRNGKKIFEGDICKVYDWGIRETLLCETPVFWDVDEIGWNFGGNIIEDRYDLRKAFQKCEVIGNVHDNID